MYHCHVRFYCIGLQHAMENLLRDIAPLEHFSHEFLVSGTLQPALLSQADVIFAQLSDPDANAAANELISGMGREAELIVLGRRRHSFPPFMAVSPSSGTSGRCP